MVTKEAFKKYCERHQLELWDSDRISHEMGPEYVKEDGIELSGMYTDGYPRMFAITLMKDGTVEAMCAFADGRRHLQDEFMDVTQKFSSVERVHVTSIDEDFTR